MKSKTRIAKWDNLKMIMMLCVVIGHTLYFYIDKNSTTLKGIYLFIYTFHMPVFIFITGLFSKNAIRLKKYERVIEFFLIYLVMKFLDYFGTVWKNKSFSSYKGFHLFWEDGPGWYAFAAAIFLLVTMFIQDYKASAILVLSILIGCLAGLDNHMGNHFVSMRICTFYPIFLLGYYIDPKWFSERKEKQSLTMRILFKIAGASILCVLFLFCMRYAQKLYPYVNLLKGKTNYVELGLGTKGVILRLFTYVLWILLIFIIIELCPEGSHTWSWFGERTMSIFIWHKFLLVIIMQIFAGKYYLKLYMPKYYIIASLCIACIVFIIAAYLPGLRISDYLVEGKKKK